MGDPMRDFQGAAPPRYCMEVLIWVMGMLRRTRMFSERLGLEFLPRQQISICT